MMGILGEPTVAHLGEPEAALHDAKGMFHLGAHLGFVAVLALLLIAQRTILVAFPMSKILRLRRDTGDALLLAGVGRIAPHAGFVTVQQILHRHRVMDVRRSGHHAVNQLGLAVHPDVRLHAKVPLAALAGGVQVPGSWSSSAR